MPDYEKETVQAMKKVRPDLENVPEWVLYELYGSYSAHNFAGWLDWSAAHFKKWADRQAEMYAQSY